MIDIQNFILLTYMCFIAIVEKLLFD